MKNTKKWKKLVKNKQIMCEEIKDDSCKWINKQIGM